MGSIGTDWVDFEGNVKALKATDFMVVAPYNDQVRTIRERLAQDPRTAGVPVGTVDKFQGKEAAVVLFSMTTSSGEDVPRGMDFLFSRNRLNVAISRARCLAYLVCTEQLLNTRARTVDDMKLIATLNAFVEYAESRPRIRRAGTARYYCDPSATPGPIAERCGRSRRPNRLSGISGGLGPNSMSSALNETRQCQYPRVGSVALR